MHLFYFYCVPLQQNLIKTMKQKLLLLLLGLFVAAGVKAQDYKITMSESQDVYQLADRRYHPDPNNKDNKLVCPLVRVTILRDKKPVEGATFQGNLVPGSPDSVEYKGGTYWVYLTTGDHYFRISHNSEFEPIGVEMQEYMPDYPSGSSLQGDGIR